MMSNYRKKLTFLSALALLSAPQMYANTMNVATLSTTQAEDNVIKGIVKDQTGEPVIGASILVVGTTTGVITDLDGAFELRAPIGSKLEISYIGYTTQIVSVTAEKDYLVTMKEDTQALEEVVVVGYGTQKKVNVVGSIASVDSKDLASRANTSVTQSIMGKMPGVTISQAGARPGVDGSIRVRGVGSFGATPEALVLVDGIPGNLASLNPSDIVSISVLKDASTAAIYGARAANGVVLVTTREGAEGKINVSYNGSFGFNRATELPQFVDTWEYAEILNKATGSEVYSQKDIQSMRDGSDPDHWANERYLEDDVFNNDGFQTSHDLSLSGGNERNKYFVSFGYMMQNGLVPGNKYTKYNGRVNLSSKINDKLKMTVRLQGDLGEVREPEPAGNIPEKGMETLIKLGLRWPGTNPSQLTDGSWGGGPTGGATPRAWLNSNSFCEKPSFRLRSNVKFDYTPIKNLTISAIGAFNYTNTREKRFHATVPVTIDDQPRVLGPAYLTEDWAITQYKSFQATATYDTDFADDHHLNALVGYSWEDENRRTLGAGRDNYPSNNLPFISTGSPGNKTNSGGGYEWAIQSFFARLQYNFKQRYLFETTVRYDGSSRFPDDEKYGIFPSVAAGWRLSEESFIKDNENLSFINNLKLKASYGILGNNNIGNYPYQSTYNLGDAFNNPFGGSLIQGAGKKKYADPKLKWETTRTIDFGVESSFWRGLLGLNVTYFYRNTYDILYKPAASVSSIFGLQLNETNTGELSNRGWEFELSHNNQIGDFSYGINANFSIIKNKIESLGVGNVQQPNGLVGNGNTLFVGHPMNIYYGYLTDGVFLDQKDIDDFFAHTDQSKLGSNHAKTKPGDIRYKDISGPNGVPDGKIDPVYDRVVLGSSIPKYTYGASFNAAYKGFDFNLFLQGVAGVENMLEGFAGFALAQSCNVQKWQAEGAFNPENPTRYPKYPRFTVIDGVGVNNQISDFWVRNGSYLRVKNIQLGYTLPKKCLQWAHASNLRFYVSIENPFLFDHFPEGWDAQNITGKNGDYYPFMTNYTFGVNLKF